jgi:hypothetical protein
VEGLPLRPRPRQPAPLAPGYTRPKTRHWPARALPGNGRGSGAGMSFWSVMARSSATRGPPGSA